MRNEFTTTIFTLIILLLLPAFALAAPAGSVVWQTAELAEGFDGCDPKSKPGVCTFISYRFPAIMVGPSELVEEAIREDIRQFLYSEGSYQGKDYFEISKRLFRDYGMFKASFPDSAQVWYLEKEVGIIHLTSSILTLSKRSVSHLGGAHPVTLKFFSSIDLESGKVLRLHDVIEPDAIGQLVVKAEKRFRKIKGLTPDAGLDGFFFPDDRFRLNDNIGLTSEGLLFYYNVYEIEPYAAGPTELIIPYDELKDLALPGGPLEGLGKDR